MSVTILPTDSNWKYSPYNWYVCPSYAQANNGGAYCKIGFTGTSMTLGISAASILPGKDISLRYSVDNGSFETYTYNTSSAALTKTGLSPGTHLLELWYYKGWWENIGGTAPNRWSGNYMVYITGLIIDDGQTSAPVSKATRPYNYLHIGDSISEGIRAAGGIIQPGCADGTKTFSLYIGDGLNAETGVVSYGGTSFNSGFNEIPSANTYYSLYSSGKSRLISGQFYPIPDFIGCNHGTNGANVGELVIFLGLLRAACPLTTKIYIIIPVGGYSKSILIADVNTYKAAHPEDVHIYIIDLGPAYTIGLNAFGNANQQSDDGLHPLAETNAHLGSYMSALMAMTNTQTVTMLQNRRTFRTMTI